MPRRGAGAGGLVLPVAPWLPARAAEGAPDGVGGGAPGRVADGVAGCVPGTVPGRVADGVAGRVAGTDPLRSGVESAVRS